MSNIPDITTLSDLLNTSPSQPAVEDQKRAIPNSFHDQKDEKHQQIYEYSQAEQKQILEEGDDTSGVASLSRPLTKSQLPDAKIEDLEKLLGQQSMKIDLSNERNDLLKKRSTLKTSVDELRIKVKHLQSLNERQNQKARLGKLLEKNDARFLEKQRPKTDSAPETQEDNDYILKNLHVLPSNDWIKRLDLVKKFYTYMEIEKAELMTSYDDKSGALIRTIKFIARSPFLFILPITVMINSTDESIIQIKIPNANDKDGIITSFLLLSPSFTRTFIQNYILCKKLDLVMYSLNSLSIALHKRISAFYKIIRNFRQYVSSGSYIDDLLKDQDTENQNVVFAILKTVDNINFNVPIDEKPNCQFKMTLLWEIILPNSINGDCKGDVKIFLEEYKLQEDGQTSSRVIEGANSLFLRLSKEYGIFNAVCILFNNVFNKRLE